MMEICKREYCTGCAACYNSCPQGAVNMEPDEHGFMFPHILQPKCIQCGKCQRVCPENGSAPKERHPHFQQAVYAAWNRDKPIRIRSSSGGIFPLLASDCIRQGGSVVGVRWTNDFCTEHMAASSFHEVDTMQGSKYVQSDVGMTYQTVRKLLSDGKKVLFSGTPCQINGLYAFLGSWAQHENLLTVDVVCHGVPSNAVFQRYLKEIRGEHRIRTINLRYKVPGWSSSSVKIDFDGAPSYIVPTVNDPYFCLFNFNYTLRQACHTCRYATSSRQGDITLADFWGYYPSSLKMRDFDKGLSCVIVNSSKGQSALQAMQGSLRMEAKSMEDAKRGNQCLVKPFPPPPDTPDFWRDFRQGMTIADLSEKYVPEKYKQPRFYVLARAKWRYRFLFKRLIKITKIGRA